jgi:hypothetical protein
MFGIDAPKKTSGIRCEIKRLYGIIYKEDYKTILPGHQIVWSHRIINMSGLFKTILTRL